MTKTGGASKRGSHRLADVMVCPRKWYLRYFENITLKADMPARRLGTAIHEGLAWHYNGVLHTPRASSLHDALSQHRHPKMPTLVEDALNAVVAYQDRFKTGTDPWIPYYVEHEFEARVGDLDPDGEDALLERANPDGSIEVVRLDDEVVTSRVDLIVDVGNGNLFLVDHKSQRPDWGRKLLAPMKDDGEYTLFWQGLFYLHVVRKSLPLVAGLIIQRINREKPYDVDRHVLSIPPLAYAETPRIIRQLVREELALTVAVARGEKPRPHFWACQTRYGACDYRPLCAARTKDEVSERLAADYERPGSCEGGPK